MTTWAWLGKIFLAMSIASLRGPPVVCRELVVSNPYELLQHGWGLFYKAMVPFQVRGD
jgi:hypothetical protein